MQKSAIAASVGITLKSVSFVSSDPVDFSAAVFISMEENVLQGEKARVWSRKVPRGRVPQSSPARGRSKARSSPVQGRSSRPGELVSNLPSSQITNYSLVFILGDKYDLYLLSGPPGTYCFPWIKNTQILGGEWCSSGGNPRSTATLPLYTAVNCR